MEMKCVETIEGPGIDLTTQLPPLASSLSDPFLHSHCSSCFNPLPLSIAAPNTTPIHYCSQRCSHLDTPLHFSSAEHHLFLLHSHSHPTSDLRLSLRLLHHFHRLSLLPSHPTDRIGGLLTNHDKLKHQDDEMFVRIKEGGKLMARARRMRDGLGEGDDGENWVEEMVLGVVLTKAVEVQVNDNQGVGVAVYGNSFSWINHTCVPNACYRFSLFGSEEEEVDSTIRIGAFGDQSVERDDENELCGYGPRIVVRSIKPIKKGEEVRVAYTDLLQPKATRQVELWSRYMFICCCRRCHASPPDYVDRVLLGNFAANLESAISSWDHSFCNDDAYEELSCCMDEIIGEYLSTGNPENCCDKLESMLIQYPGKELLQPEEQSRPTFKLHPLHHLSLTAYITLSSAYKIRASESLSSPTVTENHRLEALKLSRTSAAYYLLLAGASHHLFLYDRSLVVSAVHFWISAGESLITLARSLIQNSSVSSLLSRILDKCPVMDRLKGLNQSQRSSTEIEFQEISKGFTNCASRLSSKVWPFLIEGRHYFEDIKDPSVFILPEKNTCAWELTSSCRDDGDCGLICERKNGSSSVESVFELGAHCLSYGAYLASICYGSGCYLTNYVTDLLEIRNHGSGTN